VHDVIVPMMQEAVRQHMHVDVSLRRGDIFARLYREGDFLSWHYDNNYSRGRRITAILPLLMNEKNTSLVQHMLPEEGSVVDVDCAPGEIMLYEGDKVYHRITRQGPGGERLVLVAPFYEDPDLGLLGAVRQQLRTWTYDLLRL